MADHGRRLYITNMNVFSSHAKIGEHWEDGVKKHDITRPWCDLLHPQIGSHYIDLIDYTAPSHPDLKHTDFNAWLALPEVQEWIAEGRQILLATGFGHSEYIEELWHGHPEVAVLPHPSESGTRTLSQHAADAKEKFHQKHLERLTKVKALGIKANDTVWDVHVKAKALNPNCRLSNVT